MSEDVPTKAPVEAAERLSNEQEVETLTEQFKGAMGKKVAPYVAQPAPGHDTNGVWHCFGAGHRSGYATHAIALHWVLDKALGLPTQLIPNRVMDIDIEEFPEDRSEMLLEWTKNAVGRPHLVFSSFPPDSSALLDQIGPPLIPYIAYEGTTVSKFTVDLINGDAFRAVWVVHPFVAQALLNSGVDQKKIHVVPPMLFGGPWEGMHRSPELRAESEWAHKGVAEQPFTFGVMGTWHERKGFHDLVRAYWSEFSRDEPVLLDIRTSAFGKKMTIKEFSEIITSELANIAKELGDADFPRSQKQARIRLTLGTDATDREVIEWLGGLDCYVSPSYGEGLGIPHIWAKGQGVPMISTGFGAVGELLSLAEAAGGMDDTVIPYELKPVDPEMLKVSLMFDRETQWGGYQIGALASAMRDQQYTKGARRTDGPGADIVRERHSQDMASELVREGIRRALTADEHDALWG